MLEEPQFVDADSLVSVFGDLLFDLFVSGFGEGAQTPRRMHRYVSGSTDIRFLSY